MGCVSLRKLKFYIEVIMEQGLITFFDVSQCGFYRQRKEKAQELIEGSLADTLSLVTKWLEGREVEQTIPWDVETHPYRTKVYCKSMEYDPVTGDYLFIFWKKFGKDDGNINGVIGDSKVGDGVTDSHIVKASVGGKKLILGQPMYYWFMPSLNLLASIKFPHSLSDTDDVVKFIKNCIDLRVSHPRKKTTESAIPNIKAGREIITKHVSYTSHDGSFSLVFKLKADMKELSIGDATLAELAKNISHLVVRETISTTKKVERNVVFEMWDKVTGNNERVSRSKQVEIISEESLTVSELKGILETYAEEHDPRSKWDNVGFKTDGRDAPTKWFDRYVERKKILIKKNEKINESYFPAKVIIGSLLKERKSLISFTEKNNENVVDEYKVTVVA